MTLSRLPLSTWAGFINAWVSLLQTNSYDCSLISRRYASKVGSAALNQKLSMEPADHVLELLELQGNIPLTNVLAPGAMGTSQQVAPDATARVKPRTAGS